MMQRAAPELPTQAEPALPPLARGAGSPAAATPTVGQTAATAAWGVTLRAYGPYAQFSVGPSLPWLKSTSGCN
jgi:hypothetical protein